jgi:hypothetical protein
MAPSAPVRRPSWRPGAMGQVLGLDGAYALVDGQPRFRRVPPPAK